MRFWWDAKVTRKPLFRKDLEKKNVGLGKSAKGMKYAVSCAFNPTKWEAFFPENLIELDFLIPAARIWNYSGVGAPGTKFLVFIRITQSTLILRTQRELATYLKARMNLIRESCC